MMGAVNAPSTPASSAAVESVAGEQLLAWRRALLQQRQHAAADLDWLLDLGGGLTWQQLQQLHLRPQHTVTLQRSLAELEALWQRHHREQIPLQYLLGLCPWRDLSLQVAPGVLIPRAETELLVELACACRAAGSEPRLWADLGSGSGALAVALARAWPTSAGLAVELSPEARPVAAANFQAAGCSDRVQLLAGHWWQPLEPWWGQLELVVANPPYIPTAVWAELDPVVREHEPRLALDGGGDGLDSIRQIAAGATAALAAGGVLLLEHHFDQSDAVAAVLAAAGLVQLGRHQDLEGRGRFASARTPQAPSP